MRKEIIFVLILLVAKSHCDSEDLELASQEKKTTSKCSSSSSDTSESDDSESSSCSEECSSESTDESDSSDSSSSSKSCSNESSGNKSTTQNHETTTSQFNVCDGIILGYVPNDENCTSYFYCEFQVPHSRSCDYGFIFNRDSLNCEPGDAETCTLITESPTLPTTVPQATSTTTSSANICEDVLLGKVPNPVDCSAYYVCVIYNPAPYQCDVGHIFDPESLICVPGNPETCEILQTTTLESTVSTESSTVNQTTSQSTTESTTVSLSTSSTSAESSTVSTTESTTTTTLISTSQGSPEFPQFYCQCPNDVTNNGLLIPSPYSCGHYYECIWGVAYKRYCIEGLSFNALTSTCVDPLDAHCGTEIDCV